jgi:hypothetical protein
MDLSPIFALISRFGAVFWGTDSRFSEMYSLTLAEQLLYQRVLGLGFSNFS